MKYWFFSLLLANIVFLLWEVNYGGLDSPATPGAAPPDGEKQILLLREAGGLNGFAQDSETARLSSEAFASVMEISAAVLPEWRQSLSAGGQTEAPAGKPAAPPLAQPIPAVENAAANRVAAEDSAMPESARKTAQAETRQTAAQPTDSAVAPQAATPPKPEKTQTACYTTGKVVNAEALKALLDRYRPQLTAVELAVSEGRKNNSYLVYYPAAATMQESITTAEMLRNNYGVSDLLVFRNGEMKGAISLGVFSNEQRAKVAQGELVKKGVAAKIMPRYPLEKTYLVRARWKEAQAAAAQQMSDNLKKNYPALRKAPSCDE